MHSNNFVFHLYFLVNQHKYFLISAIQNTSTTSTASSASSTDHCWKRAREPAEADHAPAEADHEPAEAVPTPAPKKSRFDEILQTSLDRCKLDLDQERRTSKTLLSKAKSLKATVDEQKGFYLLLTCIIFTCLFMILLPVQKPRTLHNIVKVSINLMNVFNSLTL